MNSDFKDLLRLLNAKKARYLVVGGYAVIRYTEPRFTADIDIFVEASEQNSKLVYAALEEFGAPVQTMHASDFATPGYFFQMGLPPNRIDVLMSIRGVEFDEAWKNRVTSKINGDEFWFISKEDLIKSKLAAGRTKDLADVEALTKLSK